MFPGMDLYRTDPAQPLTTPGEELNDLSVDRNIMICPRYTYLKYSRSRTYDLQQQQQWLILPGGTRKINLNDGLQQ